MFRNARNAELGLMIGGAKKIYFGKPKILDLGRNDRGYGFRLKTEKVSEKKQPLVSLSKLCVGLLIL